MLLLAVGCATFGVVQTADTLGPGRFEVQAQTGIATLHAPGPGAARGTTLPLIASDSHLRVGVSDRVDVTASLGFNGLGAGVKVQLTPPDNGLFYASVSPHATVFPLAGVFTHLDLPLLVGVPFGPHQLVGAWRMHVYDVRSDLVGTGTLVTGGASVGFAVDVGNGVLVQPEYTALFPVSGGVPYLDPSLGPGTGATLSQFAVSLTYRFDQDEFR